MRKCNCPNLRDLGVYPCFLLLSHHIHKYIIQLMTFNNFSWYEIVNTYFHYEKSKVGNEDQCRNVDGNRSFNQQIYNACHKKCSLAFFSPHRRFGGFDPAIFGNLLILMGVVEYTFCSKITP